MAQALQVVVGGVAVGGLAVVVEQLGLAPREIVVAVGGERRGAVLVGDDQAVQFVVVVVDEIAVRPGDARAVAGGVILVLHREQAARLLHHPTGRVVAPAQGGIGVVRHGRQAGQVVAVGEVLGGIRRCLAGQAVERVVAQRDNLALGHFLEPWTVRFFFCGATSPVFQFTTATSEFPS